MQRFASTLRTAPRAVRHYSVATAKSGAQGNEFMAAREAQKEHAGGSADLWRKLSYYVAIPCVLVGYLNVRNMEAEHAAHKAHAEEAGEEHGERIVYPYMNKRDKEFPWGMQSLFYNPHTNIAPEESE